MNFEVVVLTGIGIGLAGSIHCIGMCGPIALTLTPGNHSWTPALLYNLGRALSYGTMGLVFGLIGNQFYLAGLQQTLSIVSGVLILLIFAIQYFGKNKQSWLNAWNRTIQRQISGLVSGPKGFWFPLELGLLNAWLPCGLVYLALMHALAAGSLWSGAGIMFFFGLGTVPLMLFFMLSGQKMMVWLRFNVQKFIPYFILLMALLLILRGLNLGIPYLSPKADAGMQCH